MLKIIWKSHQRCMCVDSWNYMFVVFDYMNVIFDVGDSCFVVVTSYSSEYLLCVVCRYVVYIWPRFLCMMWKLYSVLAYVLHSTYSRADDDRAVWWCWWLDSVCSKPECHVVSEAFTMSKNTAAIDILLLKLRVMWSVSLMYCSVVLWRARKPNWLALSRFLSSTCFLRVLELLFRKVCLLWTGG
jgi:hypothetical protein